MPNHYHLVVETPRADISRGMQRLNSGHAAWFNRRHGVGGHLFQGRFHAVLVESTAHLLELVRYLALNPVRGGLCRHPGGWRWSSYQAMTGAQRAPRFLTVNSILRNFGDEPARARERFADFVLDVAMLLAVSDGS